MGCFLSCCHPFGYEKLENIRNTNSHQGKDIQVSDLGIPNTEELNEVLGGSDDVNLSDAELEMYLEKLQTE